MKKFLALLLSIITIISCFSVCASAKEDGKWIKINGLFSDSLQHAFKNGDIHGNCWIDCTTKTRNYGKYKGYDTIEIWVPAGKSINSCATVGQIIFPEVGDYNKNRVEYPSCVTYLSDMIYDKEDKAYYLQYDYFTPSLQQYLKGSISPIFIFIDIPAYLFVKIQDKINIKKYDKCINNYIVGYSIY